MAENRIAGPESGESSERDEREAPEAAPAERFGPLELRRLHKDGRALIAYAHAAQPAEA